MTRSLTLTLVVASLLGPGLLLTRWAHATRSPFELAADPKIPDRIGPWEAVEEHRLDRESLAIIAPDAYRMQRYSAPGRPSIWVYVGFYSDRSAYGRDAHDPETCYPAQGWEIVGAATRQIGLAGGASLPVKLLTAQRESAIELVLYWFQPARRWPVPGALEELRRLMDAIGRQPQQAFVRLSTASSSDGTAEAALLELAHELAPDVRRAVDTLREPGKAG